MTPRKKKTVSVFRKLTPHKYMSADHQKRLYHYTIICHDQRSKSFEPATTRQKLL